MGRWVMNEEAGSEQEFKADIVLLAMGFLGPEKHLIEQLGLAQDPRSNIDTKGKYSTSVSKIFAAGGEASLRIPFDLSTEGGL